MQCLKEEAEKIEMLPMQVGDSSPDVSPADLALVWEVTQSLLRRKAISAGHDISDGGIAVALAEMAFAGNTGIKVGLIFMRIITPCRKNATLRFLAMFLSWQTKANHVGKHM